MSGQQDRWEQLDPRESTLDLSRLIERAHQPQIADGNSSGGGRNGNNAGNGSNGGTKGNRRNGINGSNGGSAGNGASGRAIGSEQPERGADGPSRELEPLAGDIGEAQHSPVEAAAGLQQEPDDAQAEPPEPTRSQAAARVAPGSLADLRLRLELLPPGHPSSPYHDDGKRKPQPPRLRHLELSPPGRDRPGSIGLVSPTLARPTHASPSQVSPAPADPPDISADDPPARSAPTSFPDASADDRLVSPTPADPPDVSVDDRPARPTPVDPPDGSTDELPARLASASLTDTGDRGPASPMLAGPAPARPADDDEPSAAEAAPSWQLAPVAQEAAGPVSDNDPAVRPDEDSPLDPSGQHDPAVTTEFLAITEAEATAPATAAQAGIDGSWRRDSASLTPAQFRIAQEMYDRFRAAEGRNLFGSYGTSGLTAALRRIEARLEHGRLAPDTEQHALLDPDQFMTRLANMIKRHPDVPVGQLARRVTGALSYAFVFAAAQYSAGTWLVHDALRVQGFQLEARKNDWANRVDRCVATMWLDPAYDLPFQVQFHSTGSLEAQELARAAESKLSDPRLRPAEAEDLRADLVAAWAALSAPPGSFEIGDYSWRPR